VRTFIAVTFCCGLLASLAWPQTSPQSQVKPGSEPSPMEAFAAQSGVRATWTSEVARLEQDGTQVVVTAIALEDSQVPAKKAEGIRLDLSNGDTQDHIYLDKDAAARTQSALVEIAGAVANWQAKRPGQSVCMGAREFWPLYNWSWNRYHELNADYCGTADAAALVLYGRGKNASFRFEGETPAHLATILATAIDRLKQN